MELLRQFNQLRIAIESEAAAHSASIPDHAAVEQANLKRQPDKARSAMKKLVGDVLHLIDAVASPPVAASKKRR